ncbi:MAG TPA: M28 family metallopeptidase [Terracidiphilus sp.]|jgi:N-acetylated-alpha-linked acidic dipeptidase|nr:M28 family metallopeptidase [Terracidiphilus sp.]
MNCCKMLTFLPLLGLVAAYAGPGRLPAQTADTQPVFGYTSFEAQSKIEEQFLAVPNAKLAGEDLKTLTLAPHMAATPADHQTALFVAQKFRAAGLQTEIVPYRVLMNWPKEVRVEAYDPAGKLLMSGPTREHVDGDPGQDDPRVVMPFNGSSASGDVTGEVVYANYGRLSDFNELAAQHIDLHGKIVICRYGDNFRGVKVYIAEQRGAAGVLIYSDPQDDGYYKGDPWPIGPWRPATGVQRGSVQYLFKYPGDPETPGVASTLDLPDSARQSPNGNQPHIVSIPISYHDAAPILQALKGPGVPTGWQGALPFRYHLGPEGVTVHLVSKQDYQRRIIWDVIGTVRGSQYPDDWVVAGNHRDAWVYGAVDPSSGTAAMLEAARGVGVLLRSGWRPKRTIVFCSWDAEEEGLIGSTEWAEQNAQALQKAVLYSNVDVAVSGPDFSASTVPSLKEFVREITRVVPSPVEGSVYQQWSIHQASEQAHRENGTAAVAGGEVRVGDLGSGSDYTPFLQHLGVPSTDIGSDGPYGVYHSTFDDFAWYMHNADPNFLYLQEMARVFGLEAVRMADAEVLPYDYVTYAHEVAQYIDAAKARAHNSAAGSGLDSLDFSAAESAASRFLKTAEKVHRLQIAPPDGDLDHLNTALRQAEADLLSPNGLPNRPWFRHTIYAPGEYTGYSAVVIPGVNEAIDAKNAALAAQQLGVLAEALDRAAQTLDSAH